MTTEAAVEIKGKSAGPEGTDVAPEYRVSRLKVRLVPFMLEDYLDSIEAKAALLDPENSQRIAWEELKGQLGL